MRSFFATLRQLILPAGAGSGTPRIVIGPDVPPELQTYYNIGLARMTSCITWYYGNATNTYHYYGVVDLGGGVPPGNVVRGDVLSGLVLPADTYVGANWSIWRGFDVLLNSGIVAGADLLIDSVSQPRGIAGMASSVGNSAAVGVETVYLSPSVTFKNGRCYRLTLNYHCRGAAGATSCIMRIRRINLAGGAYINDLSFPFQAAFTNDSSGTFVRYIRNTTGADITQVLAWTWQPDAGTAQMIGAGGIVGAFVIEDCGAAADFPNVNTVV